MNIDTFNLKRGFYSGERVREANKFRQKSECSLRTIGYYVSSGGGGVGADSSSRSSNNSNSK
jgi:hypothetical protein